MCHRPKQFWPPYILFSWPDLEQPFTCLASQDSEQVCLRDMPHNCIGQLPGDIWQSDKSSSHSFASPPPNSTFLCGFFPFDLQHRRFAVFLRRHLDLSCLEIDLTGHRPAWISTCLDIDLVLWTTDAWAFSLPLPDLRHTFVSVSTRLWPGPRDNRCCARDMHHLPHWQGFG